MYFPRDSFESPLLERGGSSSGGRRGGYRKSAVLTVRPGGKIDLNLQTSRLPIYRILWTIIGEEPVLIRQENKFELRISNAKAQAISSIDFGIQSSLFVFQYSLGWVS